MEVMVILSCHPKLHLEQEDPYNLDLLSCHPKLHLEHLEQDDPFNLDQDSNIIQMELWMTGEDAY